ncbi:MAG: VWA domain-containing protein [Candidatus Omnitrophica bacterium]|nr:VWA domain-containing protein [Candidatus Omnitrophota bacterium]
MRLADPGYLWLLVLIVPVIALFAAGVFGKEAGIRFSNLDRVKRSGASSLGIRRLLTAVLRIVALLLLVVALTRPQTGEGHTEETREVIDIAIAIDISSSMATLDFHPDNRLEAAKLEAERFVTSRPEDRIGVVAFAKQSVTVSPLTTDHAALLGLIKSIQIGMIEDGTAIGVGLANAINRLRESDAAGKVVVLLTDGVNNSGEIDPKTAGDIAKELGIRVYTIGMGVDGPALVPIQDPRFGKRLVRAFTEIDETTLRDIASRTGGLYFRATDEKVLRGIFAEIDKLEKTKIKVQSFTTYLEYYPFWLNLGFIALAMEMILTHLWWRKIP